MTTHRFRRRGAAALAALAVLATAGCSDSAGPEQGVSVADVWDDPAALEGQQVTVSAEVQQIVTERAFVISGGDDAGPDPLLVVHPGGAEVALGTPVQVTGTVRQAFDLRRLDAVPDDPDRRIYETFRGEPYIDATSVQALPR